MRKLDMSSAADKELLKACYEKSNPFSALPMNNNYGLLMFYCSSFMGDCVYYCEELDAAIIAEHDGEKLICHDIYCNSGTTMESILGAVAFEGAKCAVLGFTPKVLTADYTASLVREEDTTLFVLKDKGNIFAENKVMFPTLSHA